MNENLEKLQNKFPDKFLPYKKVFKQVHKGDRVFVGTGCGEPQFLMRSLIEFVEENPNSIFDVEILQLWTIGDAAYMDKKYKSTFRYNTFFVGEYTWDAVHEGFADYTPITLSRVPNLFKKKLVPIDVALIQTSLPDAHGYLSLGVSVDVVKAAVEAAELVIVQVNSFMPRTHGESFISIDDVDYIIHYDEPLNELILPDEDDVTSKIGKYIANLVEDGSTLQVGYGRVPNAILKHLENKKNLGIHTEVLCDGIIDLMKKGVVNNSYKNLNYKKTVCSFFMGKRENCNYLHDNPLFEFRPVNYTNNPLNIARHDNIIVINSALEIDLTGQISSESVGSNFYGGRGGQADFMKGAVLAKNGKSIIAIRATAIDETRSRIVPFLERGVGTSLGRGDVHYVVTEYGIVYLHGKNIRERCLELISIAHPKFRPWLINEAKKRNLIYKDQAFIPGKKGEYPEDLETYRTTKIGYEYLFRPVKISDESLLKDFFYSLSEQSMYQRFISYRKDMPHERLQDFTVIDYTKEIIILAITKENNKEKIVGLGQYGIIEINYTAEVALVVHDDYQNKGIATTLLKYLIFLAKRQGLLGFTAEVLKINKTMIHVFKKFGFEIDKTSLSDRSPSYEMKFMFRSVV